MTKFKYISSITEEELENNVVVPCTDEDGFSCILIKNAKAKTISSGYSTDNMEIKINRVLLRNGKDYFFHIIRAKKTDAYSRSQFDTIFEFVFKKIENPVDDIELSGLITSLEDYFKTTPEKNKREIQIGVFGELFTIKYLYDVGSPEIVDKFHKNFYSKHDLEINSKVRMEVKSTTSEKRIHHFKHNQIMRSDVKVILSSVMLEESKEGTSLKTLFEEVIPLFDDPDAKFALQKLMVRCGIADGEEGLSFAYEKALNDIRFYDAVNLPKIEKETFDGITNIEYDVDCSNCDYFNVDDLIKTLKE